MVALVVETAGVQHALQDYVQGVGGDSRVVCKRAGVMLARNYLAITPPGDGLQAGQRAVLTKEDQRRGQLSILADLARLFTGVRLKGERKEQWPDLAALHRSAFVQGKIPGKPIKKMGPQKFVDQRKLRALQKTLFAKVGRLAAYWSAGFAALGAAGLPAWVRRHGVRGEGRLEETATLWRFSMGNPAIPAGLMGDMERRARYAEQYTARALRDNLEAVQAKRAATFNRG